jgi:hypothetical protein
MRRWILAVLCLLISGCSSDSTSKELVIYEEEYEKIMTNTSYVVSSDKYTLSGEMVLQDDGTYDYVLVLDEARVAMYNIRMMAVEDDTAYEDADKMMPSIGIFDGPFAMVPGQVNTDDGFVKGLVASGSADHSPLDLKILISFTNEDSSESYEDFYHVTLDESGMSNA